MGWVNVMGDNMFVLDIKFCEIIVLGIVFQDLKHWERKGNGCIANIFIMYFDFCTRSIMRVISSFMHLHIRTMRLCAYLNLLVL